LEGGFDGEAGGWKGAFDGEAGLAEGALDGKDGCCEGALDGEAPRGGSAEEGCADPKPDPNPGSDRLASGDAALGGCADSEEGRCAGSKDGSGTLDSNPDGEEARRCEALDMMACRGRRGFG